MLVLAACAGVATSAVVTTLEMLNKNGSINRINDRGERDWLIVLAFREMLKPSLGDMVWPVPHCATGHAMADVHGEKRVCISVNVWSCSGQHVTAA